MAIFDTYKQAQLNELRRLLSLNHNPQLRSDLRKMTAHGLRRLVNAIRATPPNQPLDSDGKKPPQVS